MQMFQLVVRGIVALGVVTGAATAFGQEPAPGPAGLGIFTNEPVVGAPFSADVTTTIVNPKGNPGTRSFSSQYYRDSAGRVRVDFEVPGATRGAPDVVTLLLPDPVRKTLYSAERETGIVRRSDFDLAVGLFDLSRIAWIPLGRTIFLGYPNTDMRNNGAAAEPLGIRRRNGVAIEGYRMADGTGLSHEWWLSQDLRILTDVHVVTPKGIDVRHRLFNIRRAEPAAELFELPLETEPRFTFCGLAAVTDICSN
jgi:hypothetical protein